MANRRLWMHNESIPAFYGQTNQTFNYIKQGQVRLRLGLGTGPVPLGQGGNEVITPTGEWFDNEYEPALMNFNAKYTAWENPDTRTHIIVVALHEAKNTLVDMYTKLYIGVIKGCPLCTEEDLAAMGLPVYEDKAHTPAPIPETIPDVRTELPSPAVVKIIFHHLETQNGGKPKNIHGVEILYSILDHVPSGWSELIHSDFATASPHRLVFTGEERGKMLYFALRWENTRGQKGPWTDIKGVIIP